MRHFYIWGGGRAGGKSIALLEDFQSSPAHPSGRSSMKIKTYYEEGVRMATVVA
jgi:hypothetical protein